MYIPVATSFYVALSTPHSIHTSQCTEIVCGVINRLVDIKDNLQHEELFEQYKSANAQCYNLNVDCDLRDILYYELAKDDGVIAAIEKMLLIPQLDPYLYYYPLLCR